jgi:hypothetical protein
MEQENSGWRRWNFSLEVLEADEAIFDGDATFLYLPAIRTSSAP